MRDEINEKTVDLYIKTGKLTAEVLQKAIKKLLSQAKEEPDRQAVPHGKQTLKQFLKQNTGVSGIEITKDNIKAFIAAGDDPGGLGICHQQAFTQVFRLRKICVNEPSVQEGIACRYVKKAFLTSYYVVAAQTICYN